MFLPLAQNSDNRFKSYEIVWSDDKGPTFPFQSCIFPWASESSFRQLLRGEGGNSATILTFPLLLGLCWEKQWTWQEPTNLFLQTANPISKDAGKRASSYVFRAAASINRCTLSPVWVTIQLCCSVITDSIIILTIKNCMFVFSDKIPGLAWAKE